MLRIQNYEVNNGSVVQFDVLDGGLCVGLGLGKVDNFQVALFSTKEKDDLVQVLLLVFYG